jgi:hypothetical protein
MKFQAPSLESQYRHVYVVESRDWWNASGRAFDPSLDLVLTYDFGLCHEIRRAGGRAFYADYLLAPEVMQVNNFLTYDFFRRWFLDDEGRDIFTERGIPFGFSFRLDIWNDLVFATRTRLCLDVIASLSRSTLSIGTHLGLFEKLATEMHLEFNRLAPPVIRAKPEYSFPIHRWMDEKVRSKKFRHRIKPAIAAIAARVRDLWERLSPNETPVVFIQEYYPTKDILQRLQSDKRLRVLLAQYSWAPGLLKFFRERPIAQRKDPEKYQGRAAELFAEFRRKRAARFVLSTGADFSEGIFSVIEHRIRGQLAEALATLDSVLLALDRISPKLQVMISNIGRVHGLVDAVCRNRGIPSYLIINGMLAHAYLDEAKYADVINAYSESIRDNYFRGMGNVICLGDPRMDTYVNSPRRELQREKPTIVIGASGYNNTNLGSYVAVEFEFLHDVLTALDTLRKNGVELKAIIKVRDNGYREQYKAFTQEYFGELAPVIIEGVPIRQILEQADFYVSIYSQTLFEASCLGVPAVYFKKDTEILFAPFDENSELVTVDTVPELVGAIEDFRAGNDRFDAFLRREVMEKYIGPLDGRNLERNLEYIEKLLFACCEQGRSQP